MLTEIYIFLQTIAIITLILSVTLKNTFEAETPNGIIKDSSRGNIPLAMIALVLFSFLAYSSMSIEYKECENQITWMNDTAENDTQITNQISCESDYIVDEPLAWLNAMLALLSGVLAFIFILLDHKNAERRGL